MCTTRLVATAAVVAVHCSCVLAASAHDDQAGQQVTQEIASVGREMRRFGGMLLPLLIGISTRLAAIIPTAFLGTIGIFLFVALAKKAFAISVMSFMMAYHDRHKYMRPKIMHIHHSPYHSTPHHVHHEFENINFDAPPPVYYSYDSGGGPYSHKKRKKWPKMDDGEWSLTGPQQHLEYMGQPVMNPNPYFAQTTARHPTTYPYLPPTTRDSYLPQRRKDDILPPFLYSPQNVYYPRFLWDNATETPLLPNSTIGVTPQLEQLLDKSEKEDPR